MNRVIPILLLAALLPVLSCVGVPAHVNMATSDLQYVDGDFNDFSWKWAGYATQSNRVWVKAAASWVDLDGYKIAFKVSRQTDTGAVAYIETTNITVDASNVTWTTANTNIPPDNSYLAELWAYTGVVTNVSATLAQGKIRVFNSLYDDDDSTFPWPTTGDYIGTNNATYLAAVTNIVAGTNVSVSRSGRIVTVNADDQTIALDAATNALDVRATALEGATNTLNTATGALNTAVVALQTATGVLNSATNAPVTVLPEPIPPRTPVTPAGGD